MSQIWNIEQLPDVKQFKIKYVSCENKKSFVISHFFNILLDTSVHDFKVVPWYLSLIHIYPLARVTRGLLA